MLSREARSEVISCLVKSKDTKEFLTDAFENLKKSNPRLNFARLARKMGFGSRSFVRQLFLGEKRLNLKNYKQVALGLNLNAEATRFLGLMVENEERSYSGKRKLSEELETARQRLLANLRKKVKTVSKDHILDIEKWPLVYASLGTQETGRSLSEIARLSGESENSCQGILEKLQEKGLVKKHPIHPVYFPSEDIIQIGELGEDVIFKKFFKDNLGQSLQRIEKDFNNPKSLFYSSAFSVKAKDLEQLSKSLQELLEKYLVQSETADGDEIVVVTTTLLPTSRRL